MSIVRCPHCGTANRAGSNYCNRCGAELHGRERPPAPPEGEEPSQSPPQSPASSQPPSTSPFSAAFSPPIPPAPEEPSPESPEQTIELDTDPARESARGSAKEPENEPEQASGRESEQSTQASGEMSVADAEAAAFVAGQPWLEMDFDPEDETEEGSGGFADDDAPTSGGRLITGVQGLLEPIRISGSVGDEPPQVGAPRPIPLPLDLNVDRLRALRRMMVEEPVVQSAPGRMASRPAPSLIIPWIFLLIGLAVAAPVFFSISGESGTSGPPGPFGNGLPWSGIVEAHAAIQEVAADTPVLILWAYDPATAGELDLVMLPVVRHLLERRARLAVLTLLPGGTVTANRLIERARIDVRSSGDLLLTVESAGPVAYTYAPGGAAVLPLVARDLGALFGGQSLEDVLAPVWTGLPATAPELVLVAAAHAEDAQAWLELAQPLLPAPVVVAAGAGADPFMRPYLDSGQLAGLVSGYDGANAYQQLRSRTGSRTTATFLNTHLTAQSWGQTTIAFLILFGNVLYVVRRLGGG